MDEDIIATIVTSDTIYATVGMDSTANISTVVTEEVIYATVSQINTLGTGGSSNSYFPSGW